MRAVFGDLPENVADPAACQTPVSSTRASLLLEIRTGAKLKHVKPSSERSPSGAVTVVSHDSVLTQGEQGAELNHMDASELGNGKSASDLTDMHGIARALAMALEERRKKLMDTGHSEETVDEDDSEYEDDSEWDDEWLPRVQP
ncbi:WH1 domain containing protein [Aphelenchoides avenae]|nr:WH1 domain containing protein [Aphelenchus avenae]